MYLLARHSRDPSCHEPQLSDRSHVSMVRPHLVHPHSRQLPLVCMASSVAYLCEVSFATEIILERLLALVT